MANETNIGIIDGDFEKFLSTALQDSPSDVAEQLRAGLSKRYSKPPVGELELCLGRSVPLEKARKLLFAPNEEDMALYPDLLAMPPPDAPDSHPQRVVQICALASLYLVHSKRWDRAQPFIEAGGLRPLASALSHPNPYLASQAMSTLLTLTDEDALFPWHDPPPTPDGRGPRQGPCARVWRRMYELCSGPLLPALLAHHREPPAFPGATCMALRLLAFALSWLRKHFTQDGRLSLSSSLLEALQRWGADPRVSNEERQLATQLHKDFSRFPPAQPPAQDAAGSECAAGSSGAGPHLLGLDGGDDGYEVRVVADRTEINSGPSPDNEAELLRERGNEAYRRGDYGTAIAAYSAALDVPVPTERLLTEAPRRAAYHANRAAAYMARAAAGALREGDADMSGHLEGVDLGSEGVLARHYEAAIIDCDMALDLQPAGPAATKACLRKCRALLRLGRAEEAAAAARSGLGKCDGGPDGGGVAGELQAELREALRALGKGPEAKAAKATNAVRAAGTAAPGGREAKTNGGGAGMDAAAAAAAAADSVCDPPAVKWNDMD